MSTKPFTTLRQRLITIAVFFGASYITIFIAVLAHASRYPSLGALATLAYTLGLRHAVDPDHIAAIDNTVRKLMQDGQKPAGVGFFFAIGHSAIVVVMCVAVAVSAAFIKKSLPSLQSIGGLISTSASCLFLLTIGIINLIVLVQTYQTWRRFIATGADPSTLTLEDYLNKGGLLTRRMWTVLKMVNHSWQMFFVGLLFGLGFDTASEVALLGMSGATSATGMPMTVLLLIPLSFTIGMSSIDTLDGAFMLVAYGWAFLKPARKLYYNMTITGSSVIIALVIGGIEGLQLLSQQLNASGPFWTLVNNLNIDSWGYWIIGLFVLSWTFSMLLYKWRGYDRLCAEPDPAQ